MLKHVVKVPSKHQNAVGAILKWAQYMEQSTWNAAENTFDIGKGGQCKNFQLMVNRDVTSGDKMNIVLIKSDIAFNLAQDVFIISKSKATFGGAFSTTKLHWKSRDAALKAADMQFISEYFITLGFNRIK